MEKNTFDSKFRFVIVAAQRARQLLKGERPKIKSKSRNPIRVAQEEVKSGAIKYEILPFKKEERAEEEFLLTESIPLIGGEAELESEYEGQEPEELEEEFSEEELEEFPEEEEEEEEDFDEEEL